MKNLAIEQVRRATGMQQREFADLIRMGHDNYQKLESNRGRPAVENLKQIENATGALFDSLLPGSKRAIFFDGKVYTSKCFEYWRNNGPRSKVDLKKQALIYSEWIEHLLTVAKRLGKAPAVMEAIESALTQIRKEFGVNAESDRVLRRTKKRKMYTQFRVRELRNDPSLCAAIGYKYSERDKNGMIVDDNDIVTHEREFAPSWNPRFKLAP